MNQVHGDRVVRVDGLAGSAVEETDALVTTTPRLALAVVTADCVPVLMADARAGVVAAVHAGRVGAQKASSLAPSRRCATRVRTPRTVRSARPRGQRRNYEVPAAMADEVEAALPGSRTTTSRGTPDWICGPESPGT